MNFRKIINAVSIPAILMIILDIAFFISYFIHPFYGWIVFYNSWPRFLNDDLWVLVLIFSVLNVILAGYWAVKKHHLSEKHTCLATLMLALEFIIPMLAITDISLYELGHIGEDVVNRIIIFNVVLILAACLVGAILGLVGAVIAETAKPKEKPK